MGTRFAFDPPDELYAMKYAEVARGIEADLFTHRHSLIEAFEQEFPDEDAQMLALIAGDADKPEKILELAASGLFGIACRDQMTLAIGHVADYLTKQFVRGFWPEWEKT